MPIRPAARTRSTAAIERVLVPLAAFAKSVGMGQREFAVLASRAFRGRADAIAAEPHANAIRVVGRWLSDPDYGRRGVPRPLTIAGPRSFSSLVRAARAGAARRALAQLQNAGVVDLLEDGRVQLLQRGYVPLNAPDAKVDFLGSAGADFLRVILHNLAAAPADSFLQRTASYDNIGSLSTAMLRRALQREGERALMRVNSLLASRDRDRNPRAPGGERTRLAFGVYYLEEPVKRGPARRRRR